MTNTQNNLHTEFILSPVTNLLEDVVSATAGIGNGIETFPLCDYVMQAVFLKMTGFQEQKMKCICWEIASYDYEYRYKRFTQKPLGECSSYTEKKDVYKDLVGQIRKSDPAFSVPDSLNRKQILADTKDIIQKVFTNTNLATWSQNNFTEFLTDFKEIKFNLFATDENLFENTLQTKYILLYNHRNRCAHNTQSYQQNLPTLKSLLDHNHRFDNYYFRFCLLILIDKIIIELFSLYKTALGGDI